MRDTTPLPTRGHSDPQLSGELHPRAESLRRIVAQEGSRESYAVPIAFNRIGKAEFSESRVVSFTPSAILSKARRHFNADVLLRPNWACGA